MSGGPDRSWERVAAPAEGAPVIPYVHEPDPSEETLAAVAELIAFAAARLGPVEARILHLRYRLHLTMRQIGELEGVDRTTVRDRLVAATRRLRAATRRPIPDMCTLAQRLAPLLPAETVLVVLSFVARRNQVWAARQLRRHQSYVSRHLRRARRELNAAAPDVAAMLDDLGERALHGFIPEWRRRAPKEA